MTTTMRPPRGDVLHALRESIRQEYSGDDPDTGRQLDAVLHDFSESTDIQDLPGFESARAMRVAADIEQRYHVRLITKDAEPARTAGEFVDMVLSAPAK
jgi:acyl carrier protein